MYSRSELCVNHVPLGFARVVGIADAGSSGQEWRGYCPFISDLTAAQDPRQKPTKSLVI